MSILLSFKLTMPNVGSWNGKDTGAGNEYFVIRKVAKRYIDKEPHLEKLRTDGKDSFWYSWNDGWGANVIVEKVDYKESQRRKKVSKGFRGYEWMINPILHYGKIMNESELKKHISETPAND